MKRTPDQIEDVLQALREAWLQQPDLRLMQLLVNTSEYKGTCPALFYRQDDEVVEALNAGRPPAPPI